MAEVVTSPQNPRLKLVRRIATRRGRAREGAFAVEGEDLVLAGVLAGWKPRFVICNADERTEPDFYRALSDVDTLMVPGDLVAELAELAHPPRVIGVFDLPAGASNAGAVSSPDGPSATGLPLVYLDGLRDPGNVGTVLRTANAFGLRRAALGPDTADPYSPKATRASMGAIFDVACLQVPDLDGIAPAGALVVALDAGSDQPVWDARLADADVICVGSERHGLSARTRARADVIATIPQRSGVDSLNAAAAAAIVLYEWRRQRAARDGAAG